MQQKNYINYTYILCKSRPCTPGSRSMPSSSPVSSPSSMPTTSNSSTPFPSSSSSSSFSPSICFGRRLGLGRERRDVGRLVVALVVPRVVVLHCENKLPTEKDGARGNLVEYGARLAVKSRSVQELFSPDNIRRSRDVAEN